NHLRRSPTVLSLAFFPVSDSSVFKRAWRGWLAGSLFSLYSLAAMYLLVGVFNAARIGWPLVLAACLVYWLVGLALGAVLPAYPLPRRVRGWLGFLFFASAALVFFTAHLMGPALAGQTPWVLACLPTGWVAGALWSVAVPGPVPTAAYLAGAVI